MRISTLSFFIFLAICTSAYAQSKRELRAQVQRLKAEIEQLKEPKEVDLKDQNKKASYALGVIMASNVQKQGLDSLDLEVVLSAFEDVFSGQELKLPQTEAERVLQQFMQQAMEEKQAMAKERAASFLAENKTKEGVQQTESGLQYKVLKEGSGKSPEAGDKVTVHYKGMLTDRTVFDSSIERGEPVTFGVNEVIPGWTEALQLMQEGDKWILYIPYELAYGERGAGTQIPPFSPLIFEVELLNVEE